MVIDQLHSVLTPIDQDVGADLVDDPGNAGTVFEHFRDRPLREDLPLSPAVTKVVTYVFASTGAVIVVQGALDIDPLTDRLAFFEGQSLLPQFRLAGQDKCGRADRVELHVQKKVDLLQHLEAQEMCFINDTDGVDTVDCPEDGQLFMKLPLCIRPVSFGDHAQLFVNVKSFAFRNAS